MKILILTLALFSCAAFARPDYCSDYRNSTGSCFIQFDGVQRGRCEVCRESKSCFMALDGRDRELCKAYIENQSCFMATNNAVDRGWCEHLKEGRSCFMSLDGRHREACEAGRYPYSHIFWIY